MATFIRSELENVGRKCGYCTEYGDDGHLMEYHRCSICDMGYPIWKCDDVHPSCNQESQKMMDAHAKRCWESIPAIVAERPWLSVSLAPEG